MVHRQVSYQCPSHEGLGIPNLGHWLTERLVSLSWSLMRDAVWGHKVKKAFLHLRFNLKAKNCRRPKGEAPYITKCHKVLHSLPGSSDLSQFQKELHQELVVDFALDLLEERFSRLLEEIHSQWNWVPGSGFLNNFEFLLTQNTLPFSPARLSKQASQICLIALAAAVERKKWLSMPSTTVSKSTHFRVTSGSGWFTSTTNSAAQCWLHCR